MYRDKQGSLFDITLAKEKNAFYNKDDQIQGGERDESSRYCTSTMDRVPLYSPCNFFCCYC